MVLFPTTEQKRQKGQMEFPLRKRFLGKRNSSMASYDHSPAWKSCVISNYPGESSPNNYYFAEVNASCGSAPAALQNSLKLCHPGTRMENQSPQKDAQLLPFFPAGWDIVRLCIESCSNKNMPIILVFCVQDKHPSSPR